MAKSIKTPSKIWHAPAELTISQARAVKDELCEKLKLGASLDIDLSAVTEMDTAGIQLLLLARREATQRQMTLRLLSPSPAVNDVVGLLQLDKYLGLVDAAPAAR